MAKRDLPQNSEKKSDKESVHIELAIEEAEAFKQEMKRIGLRSKSAMGRVLIRKALGLSK
ncbi:hypothetical protein RO21_11195 [[Actinobacillus] muris]|uniref:Uncharacterized protein n=1 Tax=Muribacter muris TaxID=67855 RepID=A0A0J5P4C5_9PAST|nr:hypothetical protein [Muribacter muris]KMK50545.1 hypothetical protein RO21_11195 [[Actinobacillus] muris] [Muribacter muris]